MGSETLLMNLKEAIEIMESTISTVYRIEGGSLIRYNLEYIFYSKDEKKWYANLSRLVSFPFEDVYATKEEALKELIEMAKVKLKALEEELSMETGVILNE